MVFGSEIRTEFQAPVDCPSDRGGERGEGSFWFGVYKSAKSEK